MAQCDAIQQGKLWNNLNFCTHGFCSLVRTSIVVSIEIYYKVVSTTWHIRSNYH